MKTNRYFILSILLFFQITNTIAQKKYDLITAYGNEDATLGQYFQFGCELKIMEILKGKQKIQLYGYQKCKKDNNTDFYKVYYLGQTYLINTKKVNIKTDEELFLKSLNSSETEIRENKLLEITKKESVESQQKIDNLVKKYNAKGKEKGILIKNSNVFDQSEYTEGTGFKIQFLNMSKKTIKYIWFTVKGINSVNDVVSSKTLKGIGPINPNSESEYSYDYVWLTDIVAKCKLPIIKIQYMDGTFKTIQNADDLEISNELYDYMFKFEKDDE